jgi:hypothetical protein
VGDAAVGKNRRESLCQGQAGAKDPICTHWWWRDGWPGWAPAGGRLAATKLGGELAVAKTCGVL